MADTSVWVQHFRRGLPDFAAALSQQSISIHAVVLGQLAAGNLSKRRQTLADLRWLPRTTAGTTEECLDFIEIHARHGRGIGWNDVQLMVSARLSGHSLWSLDARLRAAATELGVARQTA